MADDIIDVTWSDEPVSTEKLQVMSENIRKLRNRIPTMLFKSGGINKTTGLKILGGSVISNPSGIVSQNTDIYFGNFFSVGCNPIVIPSFYSERLRAMNVGVHGLGKTPAPNHVGATIFLMYDGNKGLDGKITVPIQIVWIAMGW